MGIVKITYNGHRYMQFFLKFETQNLNNMNKDNKNTELDKTDKKLHISDVSSSTVKLTKN